MASSLSSCCHAASEPQKPRLGQCQESPQHSPWHGSTHLFPHSGNAAAPSGELRHPQHRWHRLPPCPGPARTAHRLPHAGCSPLVSTGAVRRDQQPGEAASKEPLCSGHVLMHGATSPGLQLPVQAGQEVAQCSPCVPRALTCTKRGMVLRRKISMRFMGSRARMCSAPVQPSTISSIFTPSCQGTRAQPGPSHARAWSPEVWAQGIPRDRLGFGEPGRAGSRAKGLTV